MKTRETVRLLILNPANEILMMKVDDPKLVNADGVRQAPFWVTFGGGIDGDEDIFAAAAREAREETGRTDVRIGKPVWSREIILTTDGERVLFKETYIVAYLDGGELSSDKWTVQEHALVKEVRWWSVDDLGSTSEIVFPDRLADLLHPIVRGNYPDTILRLG